MGTKHGEITGELRCEVPKRVLDVFDALAAANRTSRAEEVVRALTALSDEHIHRATVICRVAGVNPSERDS